MYRAGAVHGLLISLFVMIRFGPVAASEPPVSRRVPSDAKARSDHHSQTTASPRLVKSESDRKSTTYPTALVGSQSQTVAVDSQMVAARQRVSDAARRLHNFLSAGPQANTQLWKDYLQWELLQQQLQPGADPSTRELARPLAKLYSGEPGLELPSFVRLRDALTGYRRLVLYRSNERTRKALDNQMAKNARDFFDPERNQDYGEIAAQLTMMEHLGYSPEVVASARRQYSRPNLYVSASSYMVARSLTEAVSRAEPVNENILGTQIRGTAHLQGQVTAGLIPSTHHATIELHLTGVSTANTVGRRSPVTVFSCGWTQVSARKTICLNEFGIQMGHSSAHCSTNSQIRSIRADDRIGKRLIEKIAWKKARQQQPRAERESSRRTERRVTQRLDEQTAQRVAETNLRLRNRIRGPLEYRNLYPRWLQFWTTHDRLNMTALQGHSGQLAATNDPPSCPPHHFVVRVHETMFLNTATNLVGGVHLTDERAVELIKEATGDVPPEFELKQDEDPWSITFDMNQPVRVNFGDNQIRITVRGRRFTRGDQVVRQTTDISAAYDVQIHDGQARLIRDGGVDVTYPGKEGRLSLTELRNKTFLTGKFEAIFKSELGKEEVALPQDMEGLAAIRDMQLDYAAANDGWLTLGWN